MAAQRDTRTPSQTEPVQAAETRHASPIIIGRPDKALFLDCCNAVGLAPKVRALAYFVVDGRGITPVLTRGSHPAAAWLTGHRTYGADKPSE